MDILPVGHDLLPGKDRKADEWTEKRVNLKFTSRHFVNALAKDEYPCF